MNNELQIEDGDSDEIPPQEEHRDSLLRDRTKKNKEPEKPDIQLISESATKTEVVSSKEIVPPS